MTPERLEEIAEWIEEERLKLSRPAANFAKPYVDQLLGFAAVLREQSADAGAGAEEKSATTQPAPECQHTGRIFRNGDRSKFACEECERVNHGARMTYRYTITHPTEKTIQRIFSAVWTRAKVLESMDGEMNDAPMGSVGSLYEIEERVTETRTKRGGK